MKLKLENQAQATVLVVTETIEPSHLPILKAGLGKLVQAGKKAIVLDFSSVAEKDFKDPGLITQVQELKSWAETLGAKILVVSSIANLAHAPNREEALKLLNAPAGPVISADASPAEQEAALSAHLKQLEARKAEIEKKLGGAAADADIKKLLHQNSMLKKNIANAEKLARKHLKYRKKDPVAAGAQKSAQDNLVKLVESFLKTEGLLK